MVRIMEVNDPERINKQIQAYRDKLLYSRIISTDKYKGKIKMVFARERVRAEVLIRSVLKPFVISLFDKSHDDALAVHVIYPIRYDGLLPFVDKRDHEVLILRQAELQRRVYNMFEDIVKNGVKIYEQKDDTDESLINEGE
jgi:hypothetical protein